ncbi:hypothetical protein P389DRAFT_195191 [Cystobasidium minutum MCA 4210]|uniref:uncharacterized protein n=1 Tax=Cystobasidium minutum MCA 4210 TaxID=1397322 RepID=UPI0034CFDEF7|eukprot:jgi/Rhomi1/195191/gm1.3405_g
MSQLRSLLDSMPHSAATPDDWRDWFAAFAEQFAASSPEDWPDWIDAFAHRLAASSPELLLLWLAAFAEHLAGPRRRPSRRHRQETSKVRVRADGNQKSTHLPARNTPGRLSRSARAVRDAGGLVKDLFKGVWHLGRFASAGKTRRHLPRNSHATVKHDYSEDAFVHLHHALFNFVNATSRRIIQARAADRDMSPRVLHGLVYLWLATSAFIAVPASICESILNALKVPIQNERARRGRPDSRRKPSERIDEYTRRKSRRSA